MSVRTGEAAIFPSRRIDTGETRHYKSLLESDAVRRIYLDELGTETLGAEMIKLVTQPQQQAQLSIKHIAERVRTELTGVQAQEVLSWLETVMVYKFPKLSRKEIEEMFKLPDLKKTRFYKDVFSEGEQKGEQKGKQEGKQEGIIKTTETILARMIKQGFSAAEIAAALDVPLRQVEKSIAAQPASRRKQPRRLLRR